MRVAVPGMGRVGSALGRHWAEAGHSVVFGVRDPAKKKADAEKIRAEATTVPEAVASVPVVLIALPWTAAPEVMKAAGDLSGKVLLDCTTPVTPELDHLTIGFTTSSPDAAAWAATSPSTSSGGAT